LPGVIRSEVDFGIPRIARGGAGPGVGAKAEQRRQASGCSRGNAIPLAGTLGRPAGFRRRLDPGSLRRQLPSLHDSFGFADTPVGAFATVVERVATIGSFGGTSGD